MRSFYLGDTLLQDVHDTTHMKFKRKEGQRVDASVLFRRRNNIIKGHREWEELGRKRREGREKR